jgi:catechol 2,3-dioxygenase-like lactoylglutathione lyase family enzyme
MLSWHLSAHSESWTSARPLATGCRRSQISGSAPTTGEGFRESHIAFTAPDRAAVLAFFAAAVAGGAEVLHEPRLWPEYHDTYFGAFVRDPDGNNVEAVCHLPE